MIRDLGLKTIRPKSARKVNSVDSSFLADVQAGLSCEPKRLPCKYFYDQRGAQLFDAICSLDEYYLTRTELNIMNRFAPEMAHVLGARTTLIEFGSGSSVKTRLLLDHLANLTAYIPVDISRSHLHATASQLERRYPNITVRPVCADFTAQFELPSLLQKSLRRTVYFPGSTIGNFERAAAVALLRQIAKQCGPTGGALIGIDLQKDIATIEAAYNDAQGITAQFNLNLLARMNRELGANFNLGQFEHFAFYDSGAHRVDIRLVSRCVQSVEIGDEIFEFQPGEAIHTEHSHKYTVEDFELMANEAGLRMRQGWTDDRQHFAVLYFDVKGPKPR